MKNSLSEKTNDTYWKAITKDNICGLHSLLSNIQTDEVQFIPLKAVFKEGIHTGSFNRNVWNQFELGDVGSLTNYLDDDIKISSDFNTSSIESEGNEIHQNGIEKITDENIRVNVDMDGSLSDQSRRYKQYNEAETINDNLNYGMNIHQSICLIPALMKKIEMSSYENCRRHQMGYSNNFSISEATERRYVHAITPSLHGREEVFPRQSGIHQHQGCNFSRSFNKKLRGRFSETNEQFSSLNFKKNVSKKLSTRIEKSFERIARSIMVRNIDSVKQIGKVNPKLILKVFEEYLSEVLDCNAKILLGRKNLGLVNRYDYLLDDSLQFPDSNITCYLSVENPFSYFLYPSVVDSKLNKKKTSSEYNNKMQMDQEKIRCNCAQKNQFSSLMGGSEIKKKCDCAKKNFTIQIAGEGETAMKRCRCAKKFKKKMKWHGRNRSKTDNAKARSKKQKCDCKKPCEPITPITAEGDQAKKNSCECVPDLKIHPELNDSSISPLMPQITSKSQCPCSCKAFIQMNSMRQSDLTTNSYGKEENKRMCVCHPNFKIIKNEKTASAFFSSQPQSGVGELPEILKTNTTHKCDIHNIAEKFGSGADRNLSLSTFASSELDKIASILKDTRQEILGQENDGSNLVSNIKCFRNSSGIICQSEVVGSPITGEKYEKSKTNTIEIRIKYPRKQNNSKEKSCANVCTNTDLSINYIKHDPGNKDNDVKYCEFFSKLQNKISSYCTNPTTSDLSMLLDSLSRKDPIIYQTTQCIRSNSRMDINEAEKEPCPSFNICQKSSNSCVKAESSEDAKNCKMQHKLLSNKGINIPDEYEIYEREARQNTTSCQTSTSLARSRNEVVKCLFRRDRLSQSTTEVVGLSCPRKSSDSLESRTFENVKHEIQTESCSKGTCRRLMSRPTLIVKTSTTLQKCEVKGGCIRQKLFDKFSPVIEQSDLIHPKNIPHRQSTENKMACKIQLSELATDSQKTEIMPGGNRSETERPNKNILPPTKNTLSKKVIPSSKRGAAEASEFPSRKNATPQDQSVRSMEYLMPKRNNTIRLDEYDQNILSHALDIFLFSKGM